MVQAQNPRMQGVLDLPVQAIIRQITASVTFLPLLDERVPELACGLDFGFTPESPNPINPVWLEGFLHVVTYRVSIITCYPGLVLFSCLCGLEGAQSVYELVALLMLLPVSLSAWALSPRVAQAAEVQSGNPAAISAKK